MRWKWIRRWRASTARAETDNATTPAEPAEPRRARHWAHLPAVGYTVPTTPPVLVPLLRLPTTATTAALSGRPLLTLHHRPRRGSVVVPPGPAGRVAGLVEVAAPGAPEPVAVEQIPVARAPVAPRALPVVDAPAPRVRLTAATEDLLGEPVVSETPFANLTDFDRMVAQYESMPIGLALHSLEAIPLSGPPPSPEGDAPSRPVPEADRVHRRATNLGLSRRRGVNLAPATDQSTSDIAAPAAPVEIANADLRPTGSDRDGGPDDRPPGPTPLAPPAGPIAPPVEAGPQLVAGPRSEPAPIVGGVTRRRVGSPDAGPQPRPTPGPAPAPGIVVPPAVVVGSASVARPVVALAPVARPALVVVDQPVVAARQLAPTSEVGVAPVVAARHAATPVPEAGVVAAPGVALASVLPVRPAVAAESGMVARPVVEPAPVAPVLPAVGAEPVAAAPPVVAVGPAPAVAVRPVVVAAPEVGAAPVVVTVRLVAPRVVSTVRQGIGVDLGEVPVVRGRAAALPPGTRAFTRAGIVHLPDDVEPETTPSGAGLIAHELVHAAQQQQLGPVLPAPHTPAGQRLEAEATAVEHWFAGGPPTAPLRHRPTPLAPAVTDQAPTQFAPDIAAHTEPLRPVDPAPAEPVPLTWSPDRGFHQPVKVSTSDGPVPPKVDRPEVEISRELAEKPVAEPHRPCVDLADLRTVEDLAGRLYRFLRTRIRAELLIDRERAGLLADLG